MHVKVFYCPTIRAVGGLKILYRAPVVVLLDILKAVRFEAYSNENTN